MDKRILTAAELVRLRGFIISRSSRFADPALLTELTDHFACKVEALLEDSHLSLDEAMRLAHHSFGIRGFAPLAEAYEKGVYQRYKTWYRNAQKRFLFSVHFPGMLVLGLLAGKLFFLLAQQHLLQDGTGLLFGVELLYAAIIFGLRRRTKAGGLFMEKANEASIDILFWLWVGLGVLLTSGVTNTIVQACLTGMLAGILGANLILFSRLMRKAAADTKALQEQQANLA